MHPNLENLLKRLGIDDLESFSWQKLAACAQADMQWFFEAYENNKTIARQIDEMCLSCPVLKQCFEFGTQHKETGTWGGMYLINGKPDKHKNQHKTKEFMHKLAKELYG